MTRFYHNIECLAGLNENGQCSDEEFYPACRMKNRCPSTEKAFPDNPLKHIFRRKLCPFCGEPYTNPSFWNRLRIDFKTLIKRIRNFHFGRLIRK